MKTKHIVLLSVVVLISITACHKVDPTPGTNPIPTTPPTSSQVLATFVSNVAQADYGALNSNAQSFLTACNSFCANPNATDLASMKTDWFGMRAAYEYGESFLIGPINTQNWDPHVDSWPVAQHQIDSVLTTNPTFDQTYIDNLPYTLKGFHVIEYLIFQRATASGFTAQSGYTAQEQTAYLQAITADLAATITNINGSYNTGVSGNYATILTNIPNATYGSHKAAFLDLINAMIGICDEVGGNNSDGKIYSVYNGSGIGSPDTLLQESLFSRHSWIDFTNNITGVRNVYLGVYGGTSPATNSLYNLVAAKNLSLNNTIITAMNNAIGAFNQAHQNFSQSVYSERTQCVAIMTAIDSLKNTLNDKLVPFVNQYVTD